MIPAPRGSLIEMELESVERDLMGISVQTFVSRLTEVMNELVL